MAIIDEHLAVWSDQVDIINVHCGGGSIPKPGIQTDWRAQGAAGQKSPWDATQPVVGLYVSAHTLLDWHAGYLAPAIALHQGGGGFIRYDVDGALSLQRLRLTLTIDANGGSLVLDAALRLLAHADSYMDGPCGTRLSLFSATLTGDAYAQATVGVNLDNKANALVLDVGIRADVDKNSVNVSSGGLLGGILGEIIEALYKSGTLGINTAYHQRSRIDILNLSTFGNIFMRGNQRVSDRSIFYPILLGD